MTCELCVMKVLFFVMRKIQSDAALAGNANKVGGSGKGAESGNQVFNKSNVEDCRFSVFKGKRRKDDPEPGGITNKWPLAVLTPRMAYIYISGPWMREMTEKIRSLVAESRKAAWRGDMETANKLMDDAKEVKSRLPYVTFGGEFTYCDTAHLVRYSGLMCFDIDNLTDAERMAEVRRKLLASEYFHTVLLFVSPRGEGLKWVVRVELGDYTYSYYYKAVQEYLKSIDIKADSTSDIARACFLCHDPHCYFAEGDDDRERETFVPENWLANGQNGKREERQAQFPLEQMRQGAASMPVERTPELDAEIDSLVQSLMERRIDITGREPQWFNLALAFASYYGREEDFNKSVGLRQFLSISQFYPRFTEWETRRKYLYVLNRDQNYKRELAGMSEEQRAKRLAEKPPITIQYFIITAKCALDPLRQLNLEHMQTREDRLKEIEEIFNELIDHNDETEGTDEK